LADPFEHPVFIIGCARSGTSILGELVGQHPEVAYMFEASWAWEAGGRGENGSDRLTEAHVTPEVAWLVRQRLEKRLTTGSVLVEKNPRTSLRVPFVRALFPDARFVHIIRDGRDVACSLVPGCGGDEWRHLKPPSWQELRVDYSGVRRTARVWRDVLEIALADLETAPHMTIRYEDLIADPRREAERVLGFLELGPTAEVERFYKRIGNVVDPRYEAAGQVKWGRRGHGVRIGRWRELEADDQRDMNAILRPMLARLGYAA